MKRAIYSELLERIWRVQEKVAVESITTIRTIKKYFIKIGFVVGLKSADFNADKFPKSEFVAAQFSRNPILEKTGSEMDAEESEFSDVKTLATGHSTRDTKQKIGL